MHQVVTGHNSLVCKAVIAGVHVTGHHLPWIGRSSECVIPNLPCILVSLDFLDIEAIRFFLYHTRPPALPPPATWVGKIPPSRVTPRSVGIVRARFPVTVSRPVCTIQFGTVLVQNFGADADVRY